MNFAVIQTDPNHSNNRQFYFNLVANEMTLTAPTQHWIRWTRHHVSTVVVVALAMASDLVLMFSGSSTIYNTLWVEDYTLREFAVAEAGCVRRPWPKQASRTSFCLLFAVCCRQKHHRHRGAFITVLNRWGMKTEILYTAKMSVLYERIKIYSIEDSI